MKSEKYEQLLSPETKSALNQLAEFAREQLPGADEGEESDPASVKKLIARVFMYLNEPASREHFRRTVGILASPEEEPTDTDEFQEYLIKKLPLQLQMRWRDWLDSGEKETEDLLKVVSRPDRGLLLGFHVSPNDFGEVGQQVRPGVTDDIFVDPETGKEYHDTNAKAWYSLDAKHLYGDKRARYLYFVEGSRQDLEGRRHYDRTNQSVYSYSPLVIRAKVSLSQELMDLLGLRFA